MNWIPLVDRLPAPGSVVLVSTVNKYCRQEVLIAFCAEGRDIAIKDPGTESGEICYLAEGWYAYLFRVLDPAEFPGLRITESPVRIPIRDVVTHWMPFPDPPALNAGEAT